MNHQTPLTVTGRRFDRGSALQCQNLFGRERPTYTQETGVASGIVGVDRVTAPTEQRAGKRGMTDV
jgi:hypothetical protein